jgi:hypothetical protein
MESLEVMEKFHDGNFHLWKFKMRMMFFSKHGLWKFVDGNVIIPDDEDEMANSLDFVSVCMNCRRRILQQLSSTYG